MPGAEIIFVMLDLQDFVRIAPSSSLSRWCGQAPWAITANAQQIIQGMLVELSAEFVRQGEVAIHKTAHVEMGAVIKGPSVIGAHCFLAAGSYLRGGTWLDECCTVGPGSELKSSFMFKGSRLAHLNFVGDAILGSDVNMEAGSIVANHRNERSDKQIRVRIGTQLHPIDAEKFGALVGDQARIGANAVIAPGGIILPGQIVGRLSLFDQDGE
jgi:NDP-sugar pyrophosphorylase family protein